MQKEKYQREKRAVFRKMEKYWKNGEKKRDFFFSFEIHNLHTTAYDESLSIAGLCHEQLYF